MLWRIKWRPSFCAAFKDQGKVAFVVDATNPTILDRERYICSAKAARFKVIGIEFVIPVALAVSRNAMRNPKQCVPNKAIYATVAKFQPITFAEGFDELWVAIISENGIELKENGSPCRAGARGANERPEHLDAFPFLLDGGLSRHKTARLCGMQTFIA